MSGIEEDDEESEEEQVAMKEEGVEYEGGGGAGADPVSSARVPGCSDHKLDELSETIGSLQSHTNVSRPGAVGLLPSRGFTAQARLCKALPVCTACMSAYSRIHLSLEQASNGSNPANPFAPQAQVGFLPSPPALPASCLALSSVRRGVMHRSVRSRGALRP
jgi:hypothetical protein